MSQTATLLRFPICAGLVFLTSCGGGGGDPTQPPGAAPVATVTVSPPTSTLAPGQTAQLSASLRDAGGAQLTGRAIAWSASPSQGATVNNAGLVTAVAAGTVTVTATSEGKSGSAQVIVTAPVATVVVSASTTTLVPQQTLQLSAALQDAGGVPLSGRVVTWTSSQAQVATVSGSGLVTALATGTTTVTATSEGRSGTIDLTVATGSVIGPSGGMLTTGNGDIEITVPPGAVANPTPITLAPIPAPTAPPSNVDLNGPAYQVGPPGLTFSQPVTITMKYDLATMPRWAMTGDLTILSSNGTQWDALTDVVVDVNAGTVSGKTNGFGSALARLRAGATIAANNHGGPVVTPGVNWASVTLTPGTASVNFQQRSVAFHAHLVPIGNSLTIPVPGATQAVPLWKFRWRTTGQNGGLGSGGNITGWTTATDEQYIATNPVLDQLTGPIDVVYVDVLLNPSEENNPPAQKIVTRQVTVDADLETTYEIAPANKTIGAGTAQNFQLVIRDKQGNILQPQPNHRIKWEGSENHGTLSGTNAVTSTYTSKSTFNFPPPRVDDIKVKMEGLTFVEHREVEWDLFKIPPELKVLRSFTETRQLQGEAKAFVTVKVDYQVKLQPVSNTISVGGTQQFQVTLEPAYDGPGIELKFTNNTNLGTLTVNNATRQATYTAKPFSNGGTDQVQVEAVSVVGGTQLEVLGTAQASIDVDPWRNGFIGPDQRINEFGNYFTSAQIRVAKVQGATQYEVKSDTPDGLYTKTFSGATSTNVYSVGEVLDGGSHWLINIEAGFNTIPSAADARWNTYFNKYKNTVVKYKAT